MGRKRRKNAPSANDCVILALRHDTLDDDQIRALDLSALRTFEPKSGGISITIAAPEVINNNLGAAADFYAALDATARRLTAN